MCRQWPQKQKRAGTAQTEAVISVEAAVLSIFIVKDALRCATESHNSLLDSLQSTTSILIKMFNSQNFLASLFL